MFRTLATSAIALIAGAAPVFAEVTPAQVWENLRDSYTGYGYEVTTGAVDEAGETLTVTDLVLTQQSEAGPTTITIPKIVFQETGDANVRAVVEGDMLLESQYNLPKTVPADDSDAVLAPDAAATDDGAADGDTPDADGDADGDMTQDTAPEAPDGAAPEMGADAEPADTQPEVTTEMVPVTMTGTIAMPGNEMIVSGAPEDMLYTMDYPTLDVQLSLPVEPEMAIPLSVTLSDVTGTQRNVTGDTNDVTLDLMAAKLDLSSAFEAPAEGAEASKGAVTMNAAMTDLVITGTSSMPKAADGAAFDMTTQMTPALEAGMRVDGKMAYAGLTGAFDVKGQDAAGSDRNASGTFTAGATDFDFGLSADAMSYRGQSVDNAMELSVSTVPFPITYAIAQAAADLRVPVLPREGEQPFHFGYALAGLTFADGIWDMFDPQKQLPRDPASLTIDLDGQAEVTQSLFDMANAASDPTADPTMPADMPFVPKSVTINQLSMDAVGAKADVTGQLDIAEGGMGNPVGTLDGRFQGVTGLMDKLVAMGIVQPEQKMMGTMMLGMFATPVEGSPDTLTTQIEFRADGSVMANGQQVK